jgi:hypothetical protein
MGAGRIGGSPAFNLSDWPFAKAGTRNNIITTIATTDTLIFISII